jgi:hypothetical protein
MKVLRPGDFLILAIAAAIVGASYGAFWSNRIEGDRAVVSVGHETTARLSLSNAGRFSVEGILGESLLEVRDGSVRFVDSPCPGRYCIHTGWISLTGQVAACLPNGVVVEIGGGVREFDAINL